LVDDDADGGERDGGGNEDARRDEQMGAKDIRYQISDWKQESRAAETSGRVGQQERAARSQAVVNRR
jgi:hypothetical protein